LITVRPWETITTRKPRTAAIASTVNLSLPPISGKLVRSPATTSSIVASGHGWAIVAAEATISSTNDSAPSLQYGRR
jgi:hypothetical protein